MRNILHESRGGPRRAQRGVVLLFSLIALVILLIAAVALVRSFNTSLFMSGNIAFKRDMQNQGERAIDQVLTQFRVGGPLATQAARQGGNQTYHYSATKLDSNAFGIPNALQGETAYAVVAGTDSSSRDITSANDTSLAGQAVKIQYVVDRLCSATGLESTLGSGSCVLASDPVPPGVSASKLMSADRASLGTGLQSAVPQAVVYRVTVKVMGPRNTTSFFQSTFTVPS